MCRLFKELEAGCASTDRRITQSWHHVILPVLQAVAAADGVSEVMLSISLFLMCLIYSSSTAPLSRTAVDSAPTGYAAVRHPPVGVWRPLSCTAPDGLRLRNLAFPWRAFRLSLST